jgi:hypothetical protein
MLAILSYTEEHSSRPAGAKKVHETPISTEKKLGEVVYTCHPSYRKKCKVRGSQSRLA